MTLDQPPRILLYAHDGRGLGHVRRMLTLAEAILADWPGAEVVLATGAAQAQGLAPAGCEVVKLPSYLTREHQGRFDTRAANLSLAVGELVQLRRELLASLVRYLRPGILMADFSPVGKASELVDALRVHKERVPQGLRVLTLRAVVDAPRIAARDNLSPPMLAFIADWYRAVLIFGHPDLCDFTTEYGLHASTRTELVYANLLVPPRTLAAIAAARGSAMTALAPASAPALIPAPALAPKPAPVQAQPSRHLLLTFGSGYRAEPIAALLLAVLPDLLAPADRLTLLCGPRLPAARVQRLTAGLRAEVVQFTTEVDRYYGQATHVVAFGGVNTTTEVIAWRLPALILSLGQGEAEQEILLARLARMTSLLTLRAPDCTALTLVPMLRQLLAARTLQVDARLDCGGAARAVAALRRLWRQGLDPP